MGVQVPAVWKLTHKDAPCFHAQRRRRFGCMIITPNLDLKEEVRQDSKRARGNDTLTSHQQNVYFLTYPTF